MEFEEVSSGSGDRAFHQSPFSFSQHPHHHPHPQRSLQRQYGSRARAQVDMQTPLSASLIHLN